ncbi:MAG: hypothetical protein HY587_00255 [Candidatus Omnitrophica bacterium]|nr:hypothetical protein [Candidatus Omnitrophota bacterium]
MKNDEYYYDLNDREREKAVSFLLSSLIKTRCQISNGVPSSPQDEDVNIYLAHLLFAITTPDYRHVSEKYLSPYVSEVEKMIDEADDGYIKYFIYKVNADHLLVHLSIFSDLGDDAPRVHAIFRPGERQFSGRATTYYDRAAYLNHRIYRKHTAVGSVLCKLSLHFDRYRDLLKATRKDFFHFSSTAADEQFAHFVTSLNTFEKDGMLRNKRDEFLDVYGSWLRSKSEEDRRKLAGLTEELKKLDPEFRFELP